jgi:hypothetical protein
MARTTCTPPCGPNTAVPPNTTAPVGGGVVPPGGLPAAQREWKGSETIESFGSPVTLTGLPVDADTAVIQVRNATSFLYYFGEPGSPPENYHLYEAGFPLRITVNADLERFTFLTDGEAVAMYFGEA